MNVWVKRAIVAVCVIALCVAIWFGGPLIGYGETRPFEGFWTRFLTIAGILTVVALIYGIAWWRRRRAAKALEEALTEPEIDESDGVLLSERMDEALGVLRSASGSRSYLYDLPWYLIIGPPGAGKTTALVNSGLKFPLADKAGASAISGVGGTRYCDWWFTEEAVMIDTAGRYTTQDSQEEVDSKSWLAFLDILKQHRARQPINGVLVAISIEDLLTLDEAELATHANAIRQRLLEVHERLRIDFPVYVVFTKADLVAGFMEFFGTFTEARRRKVWGATFQTEDRKANLVGEVPSEFDALVHRLNEEVTDRLHEEPDGVSRIAIFDFPTQFAMLRDHVSSFLTQIFEKTRYRSNANLRGFYFTSGTQEGSPIDQVLGQIGAETGRETVREMSGRGKSFFLHDLLKDVIFGEAGWVSNDMKAVRRMSALRYGSYAAVAVVTIGLTSLWGWSYANNKRLIDTSESALTNYRVNAREELEASTITDHDLQDVVGILSDLRQIPVGYDQREVDPAMGERFGLSQRAMLNNAANASYRRALERMFRSRLILRLEKQIEAYINQNDALSNYEALKVYLMLGGQAPKVDDELIIAWMLNDWENELYPGAAARPARGAMESHLRAMLALDDTQAPTFELNGSLIENAQRQIARMNVADQAYALIQSSTYAADIENFNLALRAGSDAPLVFETVDGSDLNDMQVSMLYTYRGFHEFFLEQLALVAEKLASERWVMGEFAEEASFDQQFQQLGQQLLDRYSKDFVQNWETMLGNVKLRPVTGDKPRYQTMNALSSPTSPLRLLTEAVASETQLTKDKEEPGDLIGNADGAGAEIAGEVGNLAIRRARDRATGLRRIGIETLMRRTKSQRRANGGSAAAQRIPGSQVEAQFAKWHALVEGEPGTRPIDALIANFNEIYKSLILAAASQSQGQMATANLQVQVASLKATTSRLPPTLSRMVDDAVRDLEGDAANSSLAKLNQMLASEVTRTCQRVVANRYPFDRRSSRDVPLADFARLFAPGAVLDRFFSQNLAPMVDMTGQTWRWNDDARLSRDLSKATLRNFQRAAQIRDAFFPSGGQQPEIGITVSQVALHGEVDSALLTINGRVLQTRQVGNSPLDINWPGSARSGSVSISLSPELPGRSSQLNIQGPWALLRMVDAGKPRQKGDVLEVRYPIGGRYVSYALRVASVTNPFYLRALSEFECPTGL